MIKKNILLLVVGAGMFSCSISKKASKEETPVLAITKADATRKDTIKKLKPYGEVITAKAITQTGLFKVHKVNDRWYFEVADSILNKDILVVNRISKAAEAFRPERGLLGYAGDEIGENVIRFEKGPDQKLFLKRIYYLDLSKDSSENGMYRSVYNSSFLPIIASFDIKAFSLDSAASVVDMTDYIRGDNDILFFSPPLKKAFGLTVLLSDRSYIEGVLSFPMNTEIKTVKTYMGGDNVLSYELNSSLVLLPSSPMRPRYYDERVGYFSRGYQDYDFSQDAKASFVITKWRLEPQRGDIEKYERGELVEPQKPIVFYIDPATPKKWVPYLIQGVNSWQKAFEKAGFKNAIYALEAPTNDSAWSLEDARHNAIVYKASFVQNASGPEVIDPRSGEILESHINWYHNVLKLLHDWYFIQASPNDSQSRKMEFDDSLMGRLITYVCTHEVGHTLGLQHNFIASSSIPVDSLRSRRYVGENGYTPSIMDYSRFNYVAQPEDSLTREDLIPKIGIYDKWAIEWGYRVLPYFTTKEDEKKYLSKWVTQQVSKDNRLIFATERGNDFRSQAEDIGDDAMKAGYYGIKNLKRIMRHLIEWTTIADNNYSDLQEMLRALRDQYSRYINLVCNNIGSENVIPKRVGQDGPLLTFSSRERQKAAIQFLQEQLFDNIEWLDDSNKQIHQYTGGGAIMFLFKLQEKTLFKLFSAQVYSILLLNETNQPKNQAYTFDELLTDLEQGIWKELRTHQSIGIYRQIVQKTYVAKLIDFIRLGRAGDFSMLDGCAIALKHVNGLYEKIDKSLLAYTDNSSITHLKYLRDRLEAAIKDQKRYIGEPPVMVQLNSTKNVENEKIENFYDVFKLYYEKNRTEY